MTSTPTKRPRVHRLHGQRASFVWRSYGSWLGAPYSISVHVLASRVRVNGTPSLVQLLVSSGLLRLEQLSELSSEQLQRGINKAAKRRLLLNP